MARALLILLISILLICIAAICFIQAFSAWSEKMRRNNILAGIVCVIISIIIFLTI